MWLAPDAKGECRYGDLHDILRLGGRHMLRPRYLHLPSAAIFALYLALLHPWLMAWGAAAEQQMALGIAAGGALAFGRRWWVPFSTIAAVVLLVLVITPEAYVALG
jgi:hypothetical protein